MAQLPGERFLIQQIGSQVVLFDRHAEALAELGIDVPDSGEIVRFDPASRDATAKAQKVINDAPELSDEEKAFAHFWSGYFYAHATGGL
jgi:hypothetical protein